MTVDQKPEINLFDLFHMEHIKQLPFVPTFSTRGLPEAAGIYFVVDCGDRLLYIGKSVNMKQRWGAHMMKEFARNSQSDLRVHYLVTDERDLDGVESTLIMVHRPPMNSAHPTPNNFFRYGEFIAQQQHLWTTRNVYRKMTDKANGVVASHSKGFVMGWLSVALPNLQAMAIAMMEQSDALDSLDILMGIRLLHHGDRHCLKIRQCNA